MATIKQFISNLLRLRSEWHEGDRTLVIVVGVIITFGLIMLSSASSVVAYDAHGDGYYFFKHQLLGLSLGLVAFWFFSRIDYRKWKDYAFFMLIFSIFLLVLVFIPGIGGDWGSAKSWIKIFGFSLQPSEIVKITFLLYLAAWLETRKHKLKDFSQGVGPFMVVLGVICLLMILQPDVGTLSIIALTSLIVYFVGGGSLRHIFAIIIFGVLVVALLIYFKPYQANRFKCFFDSDYSKREVCYQINQSLIAVGSGGFFGRGLGASRQKFLYLPEVQNDSIFSIIGEETGLLFSSILVILYITLFYRGYLIAKYAPDDFGRILAIGIVSWIVFQALINIGGMINIIPITGVPLPFISYGGSALIAVLGAIGILFNISKQTKVS